MFGYMPSQIRLSSVCNVGAPHSAALGRGWGPGTKHLTHAASSLILVLGVQVLSFCPGTSITSPRRGAQEFETVGRYDGICLPVKPCLSESCYN